MKNDEQPGEFQYKFWLEQSAGSCEQVRDIISLEYFTGRIILLKSWFRNI